MREIDVKPLLNYEGSLIQNLMRHFNLLFLLNLVFRLLRYKDISTANFLKFVTLMEKKISNILLRDGSFLKFLFKVTTNSTFFFK